jgi:nucleotide-binding universal stress UspA family protein
MFRTVLVPLDATPFAEQALPYALSIARRLDASLDLVHVHVLHVLEDPACGRFAYSPQVDKEKKHDEQLYLEGTAKWLEAVTPARMSTAVISGLDAEAILQRIADRKADLIVMTTHGRGPLGRFFLGSVADELIRRSTVPVFLIRPREPATSLVPEPLLDHVLVPLDGSHLAEHALEPALALIHPRAGQCTLLRVVDRQSSGEEEEIAAQKYLDGIASRLRADDVFVQTLVVASHSPSAVILEQAHARHCDFITLATHGRSGMSRLLLGSVADKVVRSASTPVLVYRPAVDESAVREKRASWSGSP